MLVVIHPYSYTIKGGILTYFLTFVNDILVTSNDSTSISQLLERLSSTFAIKDLGPLAYFLGIEATQHPNGLLLSQSGYILHLLQHAGMSDRKPIKTPMPTSLPKSSSHPLTDSTAYHSLVGGFQYLMLTHSDIYFVVNHVCQFMYAPTDEHWKLVKHILCYLKDTHTHGLFNQHTNSHHLQAFSDAD